jgi:hypothetical protein
MLSVAAIVAIILRVIGGAASAYEGIKTLKEAKRDLWGKVSKQVDKQLDSNMLSTRFTVWWLQESLNELGASPQIKVDGDYGEATKTAVAAFQTAHKLDVDGWAGLATLAEIVAVQHAKAAPLED